ncbi:LysE family translocator [Niveibacterium sp.]|uniref:LysE family translocator n=1 Tax=Niveibacterium sp. TaxID=2017444 RepID=UPI0035AFB488
MSPDQILLFIGAALLLAVAPGPDNLGVLALGVSRGRSEALGFALGCAVGCFNHTLLAVLGVSALIAASPLAFRALQLAGAAYLVWIGVQALRSRGAQLANLDTPSAEAGFLPYFRRGLIANAINPKVALFFLSFLPQFIRADGWPAPLQLAVLGALFAVVAAIVFGGIALAAAPLGGWLRRRERLTRWLDRATGGLFVGLGILTAVGIR